MIDIMTYNEERDFENIINSCIKENWVKFYTTKKQEFQKALLTSQTYVAFDNDEYCGFIRCITDGYFTIYCCEIIVDNMFRRKGIGAELLKKVWEKYPSCSVDVLSDNDDFYKSNDFIILCNGMRKK
ncbi:MAG: GNAT family N-acetyltransferase [Oscillospiraceae bacterium]